MSTTCFARVTGTGVVLALCVAVGCSSSPAAPTAVAPFTITDLVAGTGPAAETGQTLVVTYDGWLYEESAEDKKGTLFDQATPAAPFSFVLGAGRVIRGWEQGLDGMRVGGERRLVIPPSLAYGSEEAGGGTIPPNSTLIFEVGLLGAN